MKEMEEIFVFATHPSSPLLKRHFLSDTIYLNVYI